MLWKICSKDGLLKINLFTWVRERCGVGGKDNFSGFQIPIVATYPCMRLTGGRIATLCGAVHTHRQSQPQPKPFILQWWLWPTHWLNVRIGILGPCESGPFCCYLFVSSYVFKDEAGPEFTEICLPLPMLALKACNASAWLLSLSPSLLLLIP